MELTTVKIRRRTQKIRKVFQMKGLLPAVWTGYGMRRNFADLERLIPMVKPKYRIYTKRPG